MCYHESHTEWEALAEELEEGEPEDGLEEPVEAAEPEDEPVPTVSDD